jgi:hypothetical protein
MPDIRPNALQRPPSLAQIAEKLPARTSKEND